ncbi:hypothetical protein HK096_005666 [Nowakowskiella sp. JEL0078]|nr:hypothetical protein HK096_005666 [Nowakowskiella sp. JEL0078]
MISHYCAYILPLIESKKNLAVRLSILVFEPFITALLTKHLFGKRPQKFLFEVSIIFVLPAIYFIVAYQLQMFGNPLIEELENFSAVSLHLALVISSSTLRTFIKRIFIQDDEHPISLGFTLSAVTIPVILLSMPWLNSMFANQNFSVNLDGHRNLLTIIFNSLCFSISQLSALYVLKHSSTFETACIWVVTSTVGSIISIFLISPVNENWITVGIVICILTLCYFATTSGVLYYQFRSNSELQENISFSADSNLKNQVPTLVLNNPSTTIDIQLLTKSRRKKLALYRKQSQNPIIPDGNGPMLVPWKKLASLPSIVEYHRFAEKNIGDKYSSPFWYFPELNNNFRKYSIDAFNTAFHKRLSSKNKTLPIIVGGGGLIGCISTWDNIQSRFTSISQNVIGWGIGFNIHKDKNYKGMKFDHLKKFRLLGIRDIIPPYRWVPCPSGMFHGFDTLQNKTSERKIGFLAHTSYPIKINRTISEKISLQDFKARNRDTTGVSYIFRNTYVEKRTEKIVPLYFGDWKTDKQVNAIKNDEMDFMNLLEFLAGCEVIVTSSYHAMYWGTLLGKRMIIANAFSTKFDHFPWPARKYSGNLDDDIAKSQSYPNALNQVRKINLQFWEEVKVILLESIRPHYVLKGQMNLLSN